MASPSLTIDTPAGTVRATARRFAGVLGGVEVTESAGHPAMALFEEQVGAPAVAQVVVLPGLAGARRPGIDSVSVDADLDGEHVPGEVARFAVRLGQRLEGDRIELG
ncbi:hypothetical protein AB5J72_00900 [Streptomyces sp. CG1]|uniref:hypothetical protein n=1 Tax=Streptomyces sp. CG1 TaxID=1287523 RepID=UPI0034E27EA8